VLKDRATNRRLEYWFTKAEVAVQQQIKAVNEVTPYKARDAQGNRQVFHIYNPKRVSQTRGVGALAPCFDTAGMFEDINFATLVKAQVAACFAIFRERDLNYRSDDSGSAQQTGAVSYETQDDGTSRKLEGLGPGMIIRGNPGEKLQGFAPNVPNAEFFPHVKLMLTLIGINLGLPLFMVLMDCSESNFSAWRGAFEEAKKGFRRNQRALINRFHTPVYKWKVRQWAALDPAIRRAVETLGEEAFWHRWNAPRWPYIEPLKDAQAALLERRNALISPRRQHAERGEEFADVRDEIIDDNATTIVAAKTRAQAINKQFPDDVPVTWRDLYPSPPADGGTFQADAAQAEAAAGAEAAGKPKPKPSK
jgi:capsid protein